MNFNKYFLLWRDKANLIVSRWLTLIVRISLVILLVAWIYQNLSGVNLNLFFPTTISPRVLWLGLALILIVISMLLIAIGAAGRIASLLILFGLGIYQNYFDLSSLEVLVIAGAAAVFYLGSGPYSLWKPERNVIARRLGEM